MTIKSCSLAAWLVLALAPLIAPAQPTIYAVVNSASNEALVAPGSYMTIYGTKLAETSASAQAVPLPETLGGVRVAMNGMTAPLLYVSSTQINALVPFEIEFSEGEAQENLKPVQLTVSTAAGSATHDLFLNEMAPALYTRDMTGQGRVLAFSPAFEVLDAVAPGQTIVLYAAGLGETDPPVASGQAGAASEPLNRIPASQLPDVYIGDRKATVLFGGLAPGFPGIYQLNVEVPKWLASDRVQLRWGAWQSNIAHIGIPAGHNVANATGSIASVFPNDGSYTDFPKSGSYSFSLMPHITRFSASMDILPGAGPFTVLAAGETGSALIDIDPNWHVWQATVTVPSMAVRNGDFGGVPAPFMDYLTCRIADSLLCDKVPGTIVPATRQDPGLLFAFFLPARPNVPDESGSTYTVMGMLPPDGHFVIDGQTLPRLTAFSGLLAVPLGYRPTRVAPLSLYIDGQLVTSTNVSYSVATRPQ